MDILKKIINSFYLTIAKLRTRLEFINKIVFHLSYLQIHIITFYQCNSNIIQLFNESHEYLTSKSQNTTQTARHYYIQTVLHYEREEISIIIMLMGAV